MSTKLERETKRLHAPLGGVPRLLLVLAALLLVPTFLLPLWNMTMFAPQYPDGLRLDIYSHKLEGGNGGQDLKEINLLNHYIGMHDLSATDFTEFQWLPFALGALGLLFLRAAVHGELGKLVDVVVLFAYFAGFSLWSFGYKLWSYGHHLLPTAAVKVAPFMPPMIGKKQLANFLVYSYPSAASYCLGGVALLLFAALALGWRGARGGPRMTILPALALVASFGAIGAIASTGSTDEIPVSSTLEGRPAAHEASPLQARIDAAPAGATLVVGPGRYQGDLVIDRPLRLIGRGRPLLLGAGAGSVVRVRADRVLIEGFDVDGRGGGDLGRDASGIHVAGKNVVIRDCRIANTLFGIYLREADGAVVERSTIHGIRGKDPGEKGSGLHLWNTQGFRLTGNEIVDVRDGVYIQSSSHGVIRGNTARDLRYGLHYMFSDDNLFEDNTFENGAAGSALMYSNRIVFRRNRFLHNRGFASVGLLLKACDDILAEDNLIADNARGIFLEGSYRNVFRRNVIAESDAGIVLYDSCANNRFEGNSFVGNLSPLNLVGRRTDTVFAGNYWSDNREPDLDGDGRSDRPYRLSDVFDHFRANLTAADLMAEGFAASALALAEQTFPVLEALPVEDAAALVRPPALRRVPLPARRERRADGKGLVASCLALGWGAAVLSRGRKGRR